MESSRRDFLRAASALAAAWGLRLPEACAAQSAVPSVVWLQAQGCSGCSVSLLNSIYYTTIDELLLNKFNLEYHPTLMASAGSDAVSVAKSFLGKTGYVLVVEGAVPTGASEQFCWLWPGMTAYGGVRALGQNAAFVLAVGACASYGGMVGGSPNPSAVKPVSSILSGRQVINLPGCPSHPDWVVGTISYLLTYGRAPTLDSRGRPIAPSSVNFFSRNVHETCPYKERQAYCWKEHGGGCSGEKTRGDCPVRKWNGAAASTAGVNWCIGPGWPNGMPCHGCTEPGFPDAMSPFYRSDGDAAMSSAGRPAQPAATQSQPATRVIEEAGQDDVFSGDSQQKRSADRMRQKRQTGKRPAAEPPTSRRKSPPAGRGSIEFPELK